MTHATGHWPVSTGRATGQDLRDQRGAVTDGPPNKEIMMHDGPTPSPESTPFAVGYGNGYGNESMARVTPTRGASVPSGASRPAATPRWGEAAATAVLPIDPDATTAMAAPAIIAAATPTPPLGVTAAPGPAPFVARPVGAAHPRRRFGRGLVLVSLAVLVAGVGIGAVALGSSSELHPASASASASVSRRADAGATAPASTVGDGIGRGVDPQGNPWPTESTVPVPVSLIEPTVLTRPTPPFTAPPISAAPTTTTPTTTPPTTAPPATTPPTTAGPTGPVFTTLTVPTTVACPDPGGDATLALAWTASNAVEVTLSIDGPGVYRTYDGPSGTETVSFPCSTAHTYLFTAYGNGGATATKTVTVTPA